MRTIFEFSAESAEIADSVAEGSRFELSGDFVSGLQLFRFRQPDAKSCLPG